MRYEAFSHPKARDLSVPPDDVLLHIPGRITAVFDGATDAKGRQINGISVGRLAALSAARATAGLPDEARDWPAETILATLSAAIGRDVPVEGPGPASTTAMIAFEGRDDVRLLGLGDTGFRVNADTLHLAELMPDHASIPARVALFKHLTAQDHDAETCEKMCRHYIGMGLDMAVRDQVLTAAARDGIIAIAGMAIPEATVEVAEFLCGGLQHQHRLANATDHPLAYGVLNGFAPNCAFATDQRLPRDTLHCLEIFSDGYLSPPDIATVAAWESHHNALEINDPHKINTAPACKGSTQGHFFDDRTVAIVTYGHQGTAT